MKRKWTDEQLILAVKDSRSVAQVIEKLGLKPAGGNYKTINTKITELGLVVSHFKGQGWNTGEDYKPEAIPLENILVKDSNYQSYKLAKRLLKEGLKEHKCEKCGNTEYYIILMETTLTIGLKIYKCFVQIVMLSLIIIEERTSA